MDVWEKSFFEQSIKESSIQPIEHSNQREAAYVVSAKIEQQRFQLGIFVQMLSSWVRQYGTLAMGDILQYLTVADAAAITGNEALVYKTFVLRNKNVGGKSKSRKLKFEGGLQTTDITDQMLEDMSFDTLVQGGGHKSNTELYRINPDIFRQNKYRIVVSPDVMNPLSEDAERQYGLEDYDRIIASPFGNQEEALKELILGKNPLTKKNVDKFIQKPQPQMAPGQPGQMPSVQGAGTQMPTGFNLQQAVQGSPGAL